MKKYVLFVVITALILLLCACVTGEYNSHGVYRPIDPDFSVELNNKNNKITTNGNIIFVSKAPKVSNIGAYRRFIGLYSDGRLVMELIDEVDYRRIFKDTIYYDKAKMVGQFNITGDTLEYEYFTRTEGGMYFTEYGLIDENMLILFENIKHIFTSEVRYTDTLIKSDKIFLK